MRFRNEYLTTNKVLVEINQKPIVWHIMHHYYRYGVVNFILCIRDDDQEISAYFEGFRDWNIRLLRTGNETSTGGRVKRTMPYINGGTFFVTYGDGLSDVNLNDALKIHKANRTVATVTAVRVRNQYGILHISDIGFVTGFEEKPLLKDWINGGYFIFDKEIFNYLSMEDSLEKMLTDVLVPKNELSAYFHYGFWKSIDTYKDYIEVAKIYETIY